MVSELIRKILHGMDISRDEGDRSEKTAFKTETTASLKRSPHRCLVGQTGLPEGHTMVSERPLLRSNQP